MSIEEKPELRTDPFSWPDHIIWHDLAVARGVKMPMWKVPITTGGMRKWLKKYNVSVPEYLEFSNDKNLSMFAKNNPTWVLRAWCGLVLEYLQERDKPDKDIEDIKLRRVGTKMVRIKKETNGNRE